MTRVLSLLLLLLALATVPAAAAGRVALVVGNADYGALGRLANPVNDATAMKRLLEDELGFTVILAIDADYTAIQQAMTAFGRAAKDAEIALFFYAGHGIELEGANYMLPVRSDVRSDVDLVNEGYRLDRVVEVMVRAGARFKIVLVDACRNNPLPSATTRGARGLQPLYATNTDTLIAFATEPGRVAYDGTGSHSPFTEGLIENLARPNVELQSTLRRVRKAVYDATQQKQFPWWDDMFLSDVYLGGQRAAASGAQQAATSSAEDYALCERLGDHPSVLMMEAYLERFPNGLCASVVKKRLKLPTTPAEETAPGSGIDLAMPPPPPPPPPAPAPQSAATTTDETPDATSSHPYAISSYWTHNGSVMALSAQGDSRVFYYEQPRALMADAGVVPGTLLFKGRTAGGRYSGQAYLFSRKCGPVAYPVSGAVSSDFLRVELTGERPVRDKNCRRVGTKLDRLVFEYRSKTL